jgi:hypothetical protein
MIWNIVTWLTLLWLFVVVGIIILLVKDLSRKKRK